MSHYWLSQSLMETKAFATAFDGFDRASQDLKASGDRSGEAYAQQGAGKALYSLERLRGAAKCQGRAAKLFHALGNRAEEAAALSDQALACKRQGNLKDALRLNETALDLTKNGQGGIRKTILYNLGRIYLEMARPEEAIAWLEQSLAEPSGLPDEDFSRLTLSSMAAAYFDLQDIDKTLRYLQRALRLPPTFPYRMIALNQQAAILLHQGVRSDPRRISEAMAAASEAEKEARQKGERQIEGFATSIYAWALEFQGRSGEALLRFATALRLIEESGDKNAASGTLFGIAHAERSLGHLDEAKQAIESSLALIEDLRAGTSSLEMRSSFLNQSRSRYEFYIDLLMDLDHQTPGRGYDVLAFEVSERARARAVLDEISEAGADRLTRADPRLAQEELLLRREIQRVEETRLEMLSRRGDPTAQGKAAHLDHKISELSARHDLTISALRGSNPQSGDPLRARPRTLREIQREVLKGDTVLLSYWLGERRSYLWRIDSASLTSYELPKRSLIERLAIKLRDSMTREFLTAGRQDALRTAAVLGKILLLPVADHLGSSRLLFLADGVLQYVPFGALGVPESAGATAPNEWPDRPLLLDHEIDSIPSASALSLLTRDRAARRSPPHLLAVLANPVFQEPATGSAAADPSQMRGLWSLPWSEKEAQGILDLVPPGERLAALGLEANLKTATSPVLGSYRMVHFATHAVLSARPSLSRLVLSQVDAQGRLRPGFLPALEIYNLNLPVDLVVLSACQTARGEDRGGEGIGRLSRGFLYAGARSVVVTLWSVSDEATARLMQRFYTGLLRGKLTPSESLRRAQLSIRAESRWASPYYWAGFVLQGVGGYQIIPNKTPVFVSYRVSRRARHHPGAALIGHQQSRKETAMSHSEHSKPIIQVPTTGDGLIDKGSKPGGFGAGGSYDIPDPGTKPGGFGAGGSDDIPDPGTKPGGFGADGSDEKSDKKSS